MTTSINDTPKSSSVPVESALRSRLKTMLTEWFEKHVQATTLPNDASVDAHLMLNERLKDHLARNFSEQHRFLGLQPGTYFELQSLAPDIRAPNHKDKFPRERFAHTNSIDRAIKLLEHAETEFQVQGLYIIPQVINPAIVAKASPHEWHATEKGTGTKSADIKAFLTIYADFDAEREGGAKLVSATDDEMRLAVARGTAFFLDATEFLGNADAVAFMFSGNGPQIHFALDHLPVNKETTSLREEFVHVVALLYGDDQVHGDVSVSDPKRLTPAVGTYKRKGYNSREFGRLHRVTGILAPERIHRLTEAELRALVDHFKSKLTAEQVDTLNGKGAQSTPRLAISARYPKPKQEGPSPFEVANALPIREVAALLGMDVENPRCPTCVDTQGGVAFLDEKLGKNYLKCQHSTCGASLWGPVDLVTKLALNLDCTDKEAAKQAVEWLAERFPGQIPPFDRGRRKRVATATSDSGNPAAGESLSDDTLPTIQLGPLVDEVVVAAVEALAADPELYVRGGNLVRVLSDDDAGIPRIDVATPAVITNVHLSRSANWVRFDERKKIEVPCAPPSSVGLTVRDLGLWPGLRRLNGVITTPILRADGTVLSTPGYDTQTGLYLHPTVDVDPVPDAPTVADIDTAKSLLLETIADFPFVPSGIGVWLSLLVGYFGRQLYIGPSPAVVIDANIRGAGKGLAAEAVGLICLGAALPTTTPTEDEEELRKRITAALIGGRGLVLVDNLPVSGEFGNAIWDTLFTSTLWEDRILGASRVVVLRNHVIWVVTGNNVVIRGDTTRRTIHARLETSLEKPEFRDPKDFRHQDLRAWILCNRAALVRAVLVLLRAWIMAERPAGSRVLGSYEAWSATIAACVEWLGLGNPIDTQLQYEQRRGDTGDAGTLRPLLVHWRATFGDEPKRAAEVVGLLNREDLRVQEERRRQLRVGGTDEVPETDVVHAHRNLRDAIVAYAPGRGGGLPTAGTLGKRLGSALRRNAGGLLLDGSVDRTGVYSWRVVCVDPAGDGAGDAGGAAGDSSDLSPAPVIHMKIDGSDECRGCRGSFPDLVKSKTDQLVSNAMGTTQRDIITETQVANQLLHPLQHVVEAQIVESIGAGDGSDRSPAASPASPASAAPGADVDAADQSSASPASPASPALGVADGPQVSHPASPASSAGADSNIQSSGIGPTVPIVEEVVGRACQVCRVERGIVIDVEVTDSSHVFDARSFLNPNLANICELYGVTIPDVQDEWVDVPSGRRVLAETQPDPKLGRRVRTFRPLPAPADS